MKIFGAYNFSGDVELHLNSSRSHASFRLASRHCPTLQVGVYCALIHEKSSTERLKAYEMQSLLVNLEDVFLNRTRQMVNDSLNTVVFNVSMGSATRGDARANEKTNHVESCSCPKSYMALSCEKCNSGKLYITKPLNIICHYTSNYMYTLSSLLFVCSLTFGG